MLGNVFKQRTCFFLYFSLKCLCTCEGLERLHFKSLLANLGYIHFQLWADVIFLQGFTYFKNFVSDALWSRSLGRKNRLVRNYILSKTLYIVACAPKGRWGNTISSTDSLDVTELVRVGVSSPPLEMLYFMPKSPLGPPGLWLAVRMMPPTAFILRITQETAGVDMMPF